MQIIPQYRDAFPKSDLNGGFIGDGYMLCENLPDKPFLKKGARFRLLGGNSAPEMTKDPSYFSQDSIYNISRAELSTSSQLYQRLSNGGNYEMSVVLENDLICDGIECTVDTLRVLKVGSIFFEFIPNPCVQLAFYNDGKQIQLYDNYRCCDHNCSVLYFISIAISHSADILHSLRQGQMCANPALANARAACCREERYQEVRSATMTLGKDYFYDGERVSYSTAMDRCSDKGLCVYESIKVEPENDWFRKGYHWTNQDCGISVKINSEGYIAIVHDIGKLTTQFCF
jgi:hypothetical protein